MIFIRRITGFHRIRFVVIRFRSPPATNDDKSVGADRFHFVGYRVKHISLPSERKLMSRRPLSGRERVVCSAVSAAPIRQRERQQCCACLRSMRPVAGRGGAPTCRLYFALSFSASRLLLQSSSCNPDTRNVNAIVSCPAHFPYRASREFSSTRALASLHRSRYTCDSPAREEERERFPVSAIPVKNRAAWLNCIGTRPVWSHQILLTPRFAHARRAVYAPICHPTTPALACDEFDLSSKVMHACDSCAEWAARMPQQRAHENAPQSDASHLASSPVKHNESQ